jgi:alkylation response protein AidB-like acyl-CoA dehydrogenase
MDFGLDKSQKEIQKAAMEFAKGEFESELSLEMEGKNEFPQKIWEKAGELGFIGMHYPEKYLGQDLGMLENALVVEEFCRKDSTIGCAVSLASYGAECVDKFGSDDLKEKYLPNIAEGKMKSTVAFVEPDNGRDLTLTGTAAAKDGGDYIINGEKAYVINGGDVGFYVVLCRTDANADAAKGLSMILVPGDADGITVTPLGVKLGMKMNVTSDISFKDVRVAASNLLGKEGQGLAQAEEFMMISAILIAAQAVGIAQGSLERAIDYAKDREQFRRKIAQFQNTQHKLAEVATSVEQARLLTYYAAWNFDNEKKVDPKLAAMAKSAATRTAVESGAQAIQIYGGYGYMTEYEVESYYRDAKVTEIFEGNQGTQKDLIGKTVIGKVK